MQRTSNSFPGQLFTLNIFSLFCKYLKFSENKHVLAHHSSINKVLFFNKINSVTLEKLSRGGICVANFIAPWEWASLSSYFVKNWLFCQKGWKQAYKNSPGIQTCEHFLKWLIVLWVNENLGQNSYVYAFFTSTPYKPMLSWGHDACTIYYGRFLRGGGTWFQ